MLFRFYLVHTVALCSPVTRAAEPGGLGGPPIFDLCMDNRLLRSLSRKPPLPHRIFAPPPLTDHIVSSCCAGSQDAFHCYGAPLHCCTAHAPALMEVCVRTCMCSLNSFPLFYITGIKTGNECIHVYVCDLATFPGSRV